MGASDRSATEDLAELLLDEPAAPAARGGREVCEVPARGRRCWVLKGLGRSGNEDRRCPSSACVARLPEEL